MNNTTCDQDIYCLIQLNNDSILTESQEDEKQPFYNFVHGLYLYAIPIISTLGIVGNACSFKVFMFTFFSRQPSSVYLAALSVSDNCFLFALFLGWFGSLNEHLMQTGVWCIFMVYITYVTSCLSVWYVVLTMLDRYIVVCHPLHGPRLCSKRRATIAVLTVTIISALFYGHCFFTSEIIQTPSGPSCTWKQSYLSLITVFTYIDTAITFVIPFILLVTFNVFVIVSIRRFTYKHISSYEKKYYASPKRMLSKAQFRLTIMLIVMSTVFLVLNLPSHGIRFYILIKNLINQNDVVLFLAQQICQMLYYLNFSINFVLYFSRSRTFRRYLTEPLKCHQNQLCRCSCSSCSCRYFRSTSSSNQSSEEYVWFEFKMVKAQKSSRNWLLFRHR